MVYDPEKFVIGHFLPGDGTIDFYLRVRSLLSSTDVVLDLGAGRAAWFEDDGCDVRRDVRGLKGSVRKVIAADVDAAVLSNRASDEQIVLGDNGLGFGQGTVDVVIADYVLEHVVDVQGFVAQVSRVLKPGGWFCARTPHKYNYVSLFASMIKNSRHAKVLNKVQPNRKEVDVFPTAYKLNSLGEIRMAFQGWRDYSFLERSNPSYYFGNKIIFNLQRFFHRILPRKISGTCFVFLQKPG